MASYSLESERRTQAWEQLMRINQAFERIPEIVEDQLLGLTRDEAQRCSRYDLIAVLLEEDQEIATAQLQFGLGDVARAYAWYEHVDTVICCTDEQAPLTQKLYREFGLSGQKVRIIRRSQPKLMYDLGRVLEECEHSFPKLHRSLSIAVVLPDCRYVQALNLFTGTCVERSSARLTALLTPWYAAGRASTSDLLAAQAEVAYDLERGFGRWPD